MAFIDLDKYDPLEVAAAKSLPVADLKACVERELTMRKRVYPDWVARKRMSPQQAEKEIRRMLGVLIRLDELEKAGRLIP